MLISARLAASRSRVVTRVAALLVCVVCTQCSKSVTEPSPGGPSSGPPGSSPNPTLPTPGPVVFVGAGDIAIEPGQSESTARLFDTIGGDIFTLGDNAYPNGSRENFRGPFDRTCGRYLGRIHPSPGNHEYMSAGAMPYFEYFGESAGPFGQGFYSYNLGGWHLISLNSNYDFGVGVDPGSPQAVWLQGDLNDPRNIRKCTLAYWHHPLFSSGQNGDYPRMRALFNILYDANADVVLSGHDHLYERFAPQTGDGRNDPARGIREFVVGTGGVPLYNFMTTKANSEQRIRDAWGVLKLTLLADSYQWEFVTTPNGTVRDSGTGTCH
jgi:hypothetical protein